ncbi:DUF4396 domain-containing protein [Spirosoma spitsbergense]|uniref:DUF4396 domain-containing protein n=1 Tax=Spirosoma spitsbergense TaxID=431554 RepID=UPI000366FD09|nr:DUF4396 domain-containing protein [Spirosoma spitsbergense]
MTIPSWLPTLAIISLVLAGISFVIITIDMLNGHRQEMWIMDVVWPLTALYAGPLALWGYFTVGRKSVKPADSDSSRQSEKGGQPDRMMQGQKPFWQSVGVGALHCGSGCTLGDIMAETFVFFVPLTLFGKPIFGAWAIDFVLAFLIGIAFQYFAIKPMRDISPKEGLVAALKADTLSLASWQIGMYGWMAIVTFAIFGRELPKDGPVFWFMMQVAMLFGFVTAYPVNWWLLKVGLKEKM